MIFSNFFYYSTEELDDMEYRRVLLRGEFDHSRELYVVPRLVSDYPDFQNYY